MRGEQVGKILRELGYAVKATPYGFDLPPTGSNSTNVNEFGALVRIENGSGIANRNGVWRIVYVKSGEALSDPCRTEKQLRRAIIEWEAGPKPEHARYARRNHNKFGTSTIWVNDYKG